MIYFLSDAHLGSRAITNAPEHIQKNVSLLQQMEKDATAVYLLGDIFDFWYEYIWEQYQVKDGQILLPRGKEVYRPLLTRLRHMTDRGIEVHFFIGNHDLWTFGGLSRITGMTVHRTPCSVTLYGKRIYMAHGDGLVPGDYMQRLPQASQQRIRRFMYLRALFHHPAAQWFHRCLPPCLGDAFGYGWARKSRMKELNHPCPYKGEYNEELVLFAKEQEKNGNRHDYYIFGHRHIDLDLMITPSARVILLGDMFKLWTFARMTENGELKLENYE